MEDECHKLDLKMAAVFSSHSGDKAAYAKYSSMVHKERELLDKKDSTMQHIQWMDQTLTFLALNASNPATDPSVLSVASGIQHHKKELESIVRYKKTQARHK